MKNKKYNVCYVCMVLPMLERCKNCKCDIKTFIKKIPILVFKNCIPQIVKSSLSWGVGDRLFDAIPTLILNPRGTLRAPHFVDYSLP